MSIQNRAMGWLLRSPVHGLASGTIDLVRYEGRRSGATFTTPTQYAASGDGLVILVGHPDTKSWWRNFEHEHDLDVLVRGEWRPMRGRVIRPADEPDLASTLLDQYLTKFPRAARALQSGSRETQLASARLVWCRPR